jgi:hypothetical protein
MNGIFANYLWKIFWGSVFWKFESCDFSRENPNIDVSVFTFDLRMIRMSSACEYDWYWNISVCSREYEVCNTLGSLQINTFYKKFNIYLRYTVNC